jgi:hypothetical protein
MRRMSFSAAGRLGRVLLLGLLVVAVGCRSQGSVTGKVTFNGEPMPGGTVSFLPVKGTGGGNATIDPKDGSYHMDKLPVGKVKVAVLPAQEPKLPKGVKGIGPPKDTPLPEEAKGAFNLGKGGGKYVPVPKEYTDPETSKLEVEVKPGQNTYNIDLKGPAPIKK